MKRKYFYALLAIDFLFISVLCGCGIETFVYLYPVIYRDFQPTSDATYNYFSFKTSDAKNSSDSGDYFKGFEVYYRIYNNESARESDEFSINSINLSSPTTAYSFLINTKNYQRLRGSQQPTAMPLISDSSNDRAVIIRLVSYNTETPQISVAGDKATYGTPMRTNLTGTVVNCNVFDLDDISSGDSDATISSSWDTNISGKHLAYVQAYVMAYGYDDSYKALYSKLFDLGFITLTEN